MLLGVIIVCISAGISFLANTRIRFGEAVANRRKERMAFVAKNMQCICNWLSEFLMNVHVPESVQRFAVFFCISNWALVMFALSS